MSINQPNEGKELFARIAEGDHEAYKMLIERHRDNIFSHAIAYLKDFSKAQDITQEVFLIIWDNRQNLTKVASPENYLFILTRNRIVAEFRKKVKLSALEDLGQTSATIDLTPNRLLENKEMSALIQSALNQMTAQRRKVFELGKMEGLKYEEIAEKLQISPNTVKVHMVQALSFIRSFIRSSGVIFLFLKFFSVFFKTD